jgi:hypothetical protein
MRISRSMKSGVNDFDLRHRYGNNRPFWDGEQLRDDLQSLFTAFNADDILSVEIVVWSKKGLGCLESAGETARNLYADLKKTAEQAVEHERND